VPKKPNAEKSAAGKKGAMIREIGKHAKNFRVVRLPGGQMASILSLFRALPGKKR
jgi:hypothetical protein